MEGKEIGDGLTPEEARVQSQKYRQDMSALFADAELGRRVREMLAREEPPSGLSDAVAWETMRKEDQSNEARAAWDWLRRELLGESPSVGEILDAFKAGIDAGPLGSPEYREAAGSLATGGATGEPEHGRRIGNDLCDCDKPAIRPEDAEYWPCGARKDEEQP